MHQRPAFPLLLVLLAVSLDASAQSRRPIPYPVMPTPQFERAVEQGTRTTSGEPGPTYWTNTADYTIEVSLSPETKMLNGTETIRYHNNSPDELRFVLVHLRQNLHKENAMRNRFVPITGGIEISEVKAGGQVLQEGTSGNEAGYRSRGTLMQVVLPEPLPTGGAAELTFAWSFEVPERGAPRMGQDGEVFYLAYWYPQVAVYDDVNGWKADQYMGNGEFYMGYGNYDVEITVPEGWVIGATGTLQNPEAVLSETARTRLAEAAQTRETVSIVGEDERAAGASTATSDTGTLTWRFQADNVRDFAFGTSNRYVWDATTANVGDRDGDGQDDTAMIHAFYRPGTTSWNRSAEFAQFSIEHLSKTIMPYPYPHMTTVEGIIGGGMEYPMITLIGGARNDRSLFGVTYHEIGHMWFPMVVGQDEKQYTWMDEGLTSFNTNEGTGDFWQENSWDPARQGYYRIAGTGMEVELMRHADDYPDGTPARGIAGYSKPAVTLHALRGMIGEDRFRPIYQEYARRWAFKHPQPYDLFNTFEDQLGEDLDWFWRTMVYETWTLDQAVASVEQSGEQVLVTIEDRGLSPMPAAVRVTYEDGRTAEQVVPVETWLNGEREATLTFDPGVVTRVEIDPGQYFPDVNRENNVWRNSNENH
ncbi:MAG: M1 family metallopeptidase [Bacteroidetes bacterium]|nr:M1 family metallopeptidase [Bacteroidota bacterium]